MVDQHLNWKEQISTIKKKASRGIGMLKYSKKYLPLLTIQSTYKSILNIAALYGEAVTPQQ